MDYKYRHKAALIAAILFLQGACFMPSLVSAAGSVDTSQEEAAVRKAERELLVAQNNLIEAQRALIAKQQLALQQATGKTYPEISSLPSNYSSAAASSDGNKIRPYATAPVIRPVELPIETESVPESLKPTILPGKQAVQNEAATSPVVKMPKTVNMADIQQMIAKNHGVLAREEKDIYTTEAAIPFTFTGFSRRESVDAVLDALQAVNGRATFFVTEGEMRKNEAAVRDVLRDGQELALCIYPKPTESVADVCADIIRGKELLKTKYGVDTQLVKQFSGVVRKETQEAVAATGNRLIGTRINAVQSRHKDYPSAEKILPEIFGANTLSATRGGIINIRMDWYTKPDLAAELFLYIKRKKIDNIAYNAFGDVSGVNPANDSAYALRSVGDILADTAHLWTYPVPKDLICRS